MEVHRVMRRGFLEAIYYEALALEFRLREIPFVSQVPCSVEYKGPRSTTSPADYAQVLNYLAVSGHEVAVLVNFGRPSLEYRRFALSEQ